MKIIIQVVVVMFLCGSNPIFAQHSLLWVKQVGQKTDERLSAISKYIETDVVAGGHYLNQEDLKLYPFITRVSPGGTVLWETHFETDLPAKLNAICVDSKLNIYGAGQIQDNKFDPYTDFFLMKTNGKGDLLWKKSIPGAGYDEVNGMVYSKATNCVTLIGYQDTRYYNEPHGVVMQVDTAGNKLWRYIYPGSYGEKFSHIIETADGGFAFVGYEQYNNDGNRMIVVGKLTQAGKEEWVQSFDIGQMAMANSIAEAKGGGFVIGGLIREDDTPVHDMVMLRLDAGGNKMWTKILREKDDEEVADLIITDDNRVLLLAYVKDRNRGKSDIWLLEFDIDGNAVWDHLLTSRSIDFGQRMVQNKYGGVLIAGSTYDHMRGDWDGALLYFQKSKAPIVQWKSPEHQNIVVDNPTFWVDARLTSSDSLNIVQILHNGKQIPEQYNVFFKSGEESVYMASIKAETTLEKGANYIWIKALNSYGETVSKVYSILYAPVPGGRK